MIRVTVKHGPTGALQSPRGKPSTLERNSLAVVQLCRLWQNIMAHSFRNHPWWVFCKQSLKYEQWVPRSVRDPPLPCLPSPTLQKAVLVLPGLESRPRNPSLALGISKADLLGFYRVTSILLKVLGQRHFTSALHFPLPKR